MWPPALLERARALVEALRASGTMVATAESCTGGLVAALLTEIPGSSEVLDRGFVTYSNAAKTEVLAVPETVLVRHGAVSRETALAMASGALARSRAQASVSITGIAGPGGGSDDKPVGLVHFARARRDGDAAAVERRFGPIGRSGIRLASVAEALRLFEDLLDPPSGRPHAAP